MNVISTLSISMPVLLYFANMAVASVLVCGCGILLERIARHTSLPFRHALLVVARASSVSAPVVIGVMLASGTSLTHFDLTGLERSTIVTLVSASNRPDQSFSATSLPPAQSVSSTKTDDVRDGLGSTMAETSADAPALNVLNLSSRSFWLNQLPLLGTSLVVVWIVGSVVLLWRLMRVLLQLRRLFNGLRPVTDAQLRELAAAMSRQLGLRTVPELYESNVVLSPLSVGPIRPLIVLPLGIASFEANQLRCLFLHEMAHIIRRDHQIGVLQRLATILFWWNPLTWRASALVSAIREQICDDISTGDSRADGYAAMLVELAGRVACSRALPATIGVFDAAAGDFIQRIHRLLDPHRRRVTQLDGRSKVLAALCFLLLLLPAAAPLDLRAAVVDESPPPAGQSNEPLNAADAEPSKNAEEKTPTSENPEAAPINWPNILRGVIKDADGKPIAGAHVRFDFEKIHEYMIGRWDELLDSQSQVTGDSGEYRFDTAKLPRLTHRPFLLMITCTAKGYADAKWWSWYSFNDVNVDEHLTNVKMLPGRVVQGRCIDPDGVPVSGAIVKMARGHDSQSPAGNWAWDPRKTQDDGTFEFSVARDDKGAFEVWAVHPQWAPRRITLPSGGDDLGDIRLRRGSPIQGAVRNADGKPVAGAVVVAESVDKGELKSVAFEVTVAARTDAKGNYTLQPLLGRYKFYLSQAEETNNRLDPRFVVADGPPPPVTPARLEVFAYEPQTKDFVAGPTLKVRGTVRWADGRPVGRCEVKASYLPPDNGTGIWIARTVTNDQGHYTIELPNPIDNVSIDVFGARDEQGVWHSAVPADNVDAKQKSEQNMQLNPLDGDLDNMDWVLKADKQ